MEKKRTKRVDRISELPESILHCILSFLPFKEIAQTSVLSKRWQRVWRAYPVLEFDETIFDEDLEEFDYSDEDAKRRRSEVFNCVVETICNRHKDMISLTEFKLSLPLYDDREFMSFVNQCVCHAIGCNVRKLKLLLAPSWSDECRYKLPQIVLFAKSLEILKLDGCKVELPRSELNLSSLRKLTCSYVRIDDHMIKKLVSGCPLIEHLNFTECKGFKNIELFGLPKLDKFELLSNEKVKRLDIKSVNVRSLKISRSDKTLEINLVSCKNLTRLMLYAVPITDEWLHGLISELPVLELLHIINCYNLRSINISSSSLEELYLCEVVDCNLIELKIDTPNLRCLMYRGSVTSLSLSATILSKINLYCNCENVETQKSIEFLSNFHHFSDALSLQIVDMYKDVMVPGDLRRTLSSPLSSLELLNFIFIRIQTRFSIAKLVDGLLWFAPHTKTISVRNIYRYELSFKFTYKKQLLHEGETTSCCKSRPLSCWDHCMETVNVKFTDGHNSIRYTLTGARIWEKIVALSDVWWLLKSA